MNLKRLIEFSDIFRGGRVMETLAASCAVIAARQCGLSLTLHQIAVCLVHIFLVRLR
jgi:hypothetical protein